MITESDCLIRDVGRRKQAMEMPIKNPEEIKSVGTEIGEEPRVPSHENHGKDTFRKYIFNRSNYTDTK